MVEHKIKHNGQINKSIQYKRIETFLIYIPEYDLYYILYIFKNIKKQILYLKTEQRIQVYRQKSQNF